MHGLEERFKDLRLSEVASLEVKDFKATAEVLEGGWRERWLVLSHSHFPRYLLEAGTRVACPILDTIAVSQRGDEMKYYCASQYKEGPALQGVHFHDRKD